MADRKPDMTTNEVRQGDRHKGNLRVLIISIVVIIIAFIAAYAYNTMVSPSTVTTTPSGESIDESNLLSQDEIDAVEDGTPAAADEDAGELAVTPQ